MTSTLNPHFLSQMDATPTLNLQDGTDFPHSGLFDMLHKGLKGSFAYKASVTDFDIAQSAPGSFTQFVIAAGAVMRDGVTAVIATDTILLDTSVAEGGITTTGVGSLTANQDVTPVAGGDVYLMLVADASNALKIVGNNSTINKVPMILATDIPIALIKMVAGSDDDATDRPIQYFTTDKTANGLALMYDNSGVAAKAAEITSSASGTTWNAEANNDITFVKPTGQIDLLLTQMQATDTGPTLTIRNQRGGGGANTTSAGSIIFKADDDGSNDQILSKIISKYINSANGSEYGDLRMSIANQNGSLVETLSLVGSAAAADVRVGVKTAAPESTLDVTGTIGATYVGDTATTKNLDITSSFVTLSNASAVTVNLPAVADATNRIYSLKNNGGGTATLTPNGSETITLATGAAPTSLALNQGEWAIIIGGSGTWHVMAKGTVM